MSNRKWMPVLPEKVSKDIDDQATVWVNTNRLYEKLALAIRSIPDENKRVQVIKVQQNALAKMKTEREMFVPMTVGEVKISFGSNIDKMPYNTFRVEVGAEDNDAAKWKNRRQKLPRKSLERKQQEPLLHVKGAKVTQG